VLTTVIDTGLNCTFCRAVAFTWFFTVSRSMCNVNPLGLSFIFC
jgi:hypothetical protein